MSACTTANTVDLSSSHILPAFNPQLAVMPSPNVCVVVSAARSLWNLLRGEETRKRAEAVIGGKWTKQVTNSSIKGGSVTVNGAVCSFKARPLICGDVVSVDLCAAVAVQVEQRRARALAVIPSRLYEDDSLLVFVASAGTGRQRLALVALPELYGKQSAASFRIVSRMYACMPGIVVVAKNAEADSAVSASLQMTFRALCLGEIKSDTLRIGPTCNAANARISGDEEKTPPQSGQLPSRVRGLASSTEAKGDSLPDAATTIVTVRERVRSNNAGHVTLVDLEHEGECFKHQLRYTLTHSHTHTLTHSHTHTLTHSHTHTHTHTNTHHTLTHSHTHTHTHTNTQTRTHTHTHTTQTSHAPGGVPSRRERSTHEASKVGFQRNLHGAEASEVPPPR